MDRTIIIIAVAAALAVGAFFLLMPKGGGGSDVAGADWAFTADEALVIGGYGDNFAYDGTNVRGIPGSARVVLDTDADEGTITATLRTNSDSGPVVMADGTPLTGRIELVMKVGQQGTRFQEFVDLHGDTGNEAPVMPKIFNYLAGWGPTDVYVNGELQYEDLVGHIMFSERSRRSDGSIRRGDEVYSPMLEDKTGFTDAGDTEFHFVAHTTEPDPDNFPPHTIWLHLNFQDVEVQQAPRMGQIPSN